MGKKSGGKPFTPADKARIMKTEARNTGGQVKTGKFAAKVQHLVDTAPVVKPTTPRDGGNQG